jgi:hypothetical protein
MSSNSQVVIQRVRVLRRWIVALVCFGLFCVGPALGQRQPPPKKMSPEKMVLEAKTYVEKMEKVANDGNILVTEAREEQNIQKLSCLNDTLTAIKGLLRLSEQNFSLMKNRIRKSRKVEHEFVKISIAHTKVRELDGRLRSCSGPTDSGQVDGRPFITVQKDTDLPTEDPLEGLSEIYLNLERPPSASPFF